MSTLYFLQYRTMDELLGAVMTDLSAFNADSSIETAELIKIAQDCTYSLGLKIYQTKETILDIEHGRTKLPADFHIMNYGLLCNHWETVYPSISNGIQGHTVMTSHTSPNLTTCPCWSVTCTNAVSVPVTFCDNSTKVVDFTAGTTKICASNIDISQAPAGVIAIATNSFCFMDHSTGDFNCNLPSCNTCNSTPCNCNTVHADPWFKNKVYSLCDNTVGVKVVEQCKFETREYTTFEKVYFVTSKQATAFTLNAQFRQSCNRAQIRNNFIELGVNHGKLYICYEGAMEDEDGNLLVLDHPKINMYYEYSLKKRILENLYLNGDPDLERRLQYVINELRVARASALAIAAMPDYSDMVNNYSAHRLNAYGKYMLPFQRMYGSEGYIQYNNY